MLSFFSWNGSAEESRLKLMGHWSADELRAALHTGDVSALQAKGSPGSPIRCYSGSCAAEYSGVLGFASSLMLLHSDKPATVVFALRLLDSMSTTLATGALATIVRPLAEAMACSIKPMWARDDPLLDADLLMMMLRVLADFVALRCQLSCRVVDVSRGAQTTSSHVGQDFVAGESLQFLHTCFERFEAKSVKDERAASELRRSIAHSLRFVVQPASEASDYLRAHINDEMPFKRDVEYLLRTVLYAISLCSRSIAPADVPACLDLIQKNLSPDKIKLYPGPKAAAARCLALLWKEKAVRSTAEHLVSLQQAASDTAHEADSASFVTIVGALEFIFAATSWPKVDDFHRSGTFSWLTDVLPRLCCNSADAFVAAARLTCRWAELSSNRSLPFDDLCSELRTACMVSAMSLTVLCLTRWPLGIGSERQGPLIAAVESMAHLLCHGIDTEGVCLTASLTEAVNTHMATVALFHAPAMVGLAARIARHARRDVDVEPQIAWRHLASFATHLQRAISLCSSSSSSADLVTPLARAIASVEQILELNRDVDDRQIRVSLVRDVVIGTFLSTTQGSLPASAAALDEAAAALLDRLLRDPDGSACVAALPVAHIHLIHRVRSRHRGWVFDGPVVRILAKVFADPSVVGPMRKRQDVLEMIAFHDPAIRDATERVLEATLMRHVYKRHRGTSTPHAVIRIIVAFAGDDRAVSAFLTSDVSIFNLLL